MHSQERTKVSRSYVNSCIHVSSYPNLNPQFTSNLPCDSIKSTNRSVYKNRRQTKINHKFQHTKVTADDNIRQRSSPEFTAGK